MKTIDIYRHGESKTYDVNGREKFSNVWQVVESFKCVEMSMTSDKAVATYGTEQEKVEAYFYVDVSKQDKKENFDIQKGDYILETDCRNRCWKVLSNKEQEIICSCFYIIITGQRLTSREQKSLVIPNVAIK